MRRSQRSMKVFLAAAIALLATCALFASAASASLVAAKFSAEEFNFSASGAYTLKRNGAEAKTCELKSSLEGGLFGSQSNFLVSNGTFGESIFTCPNTLGGRLEMLYRGEALYDNVAGTYSLHVLDYTGQEFVSPFGYYLQSAEQKDRGTWTNGSGATSSTVTFKEAPIGHDSGGKTITFSGTLKVTTPSGGLVTLSH